MSRRCAVAEELGLLARAAADAPGCPQYAAGEAGGKAGGKAAGAHVLRAEADFFSSLEPTIKQNAPLSKAGQTRWHIFAPEDDLAEVLRHSRWINFIGAAVTPEFMAAAKSGVPVCVFEPSRARMEAFLEQLPLPMLAKKNCMFFSGDAFSFAEPLRDMFPEGLTEFGPPAIYDRGDCPPDYTEEVRASLLCAYYHEQLYPYECGAHMDELRPVAGGYGFAQLRHLIENVGILGGAGQLGKLGRVAPGQAGSLGQAGTVADLRGMLAGKPALIVAAGPSAREQLPVIRRLRPHCVTMSAGKSWRMLAQEGLEPDFTVLLDATVPSSRELVEMKGDGSALVCYMLAGGARSAAARRFFFGSALENFGLEECMVPHLGSVANYMFYLASVLGCGPIYVAGVSLASREHLGSGYAPGLNPAKFKERNWPYAVTPPGHKEPLYTTLNFFDTAHWLRGYIRKAGLEVINLTHDSILYGPGITHVAEPVMDEPELSRPFSFPRPELPEDVPARAEHTLKLYYDAWKFVEEECGRLLALKGRSGFTEAFAESLRSFDANGITTALRSFYQYRNDVRHFPERFFRGDEPTRTEAAATYLMNLHAAAKLMLETLLNYQPQN